MENSRTIGARYRVKEKKDGTASPTQVCVIKPDGSVERFTLGSDTDELDFVRGATPVAWCAPDPTEDLTRFRPHHVKWRKAKAGEDINSWPANLVRKTGKTVEIATHVPDRYEGLQAGDCIAMVLGPGNAWAFALARQAQRLGDATQVLRIPTFRLKQLRPQKADKESDAQTLAKLALAQPEQFYRIRPRELKFIELQLAYRSWNEAMKDRIRCEVRLIGRERDRVFVNEPELYPEGLIEECYAERKASNPTLIALLAEEKNRLTEVTRLLKDLDVYAKIFEPIEGLGVSIAARFISGIGNILRFRSDAALAAYCGVHVCRGGKFGDDVATERQFPRHRAGQVSNWSGLLRQALFLFADQANRRPNSDWGKKLREIKTRLRQQHPEPVVIQANGKSVKRYTDGHIHKMACWRLARLFVRHIFRAWSRLEREATEAQPSSLPNTPASQPAQGSEPQSNDPQAKTGQEEVA